MKRKLGGTRRKISERQVLDQKTLDDIIRRIVEVAQPLSGLSSSDQQPEAT